MKRWKIVGINFDHMHMGDLLRRVHEHPRAELVGICDEQPQRMQEAIRNFSVPRDRVFTDYRVCLETTKPDLVILCPATAEHALWTKRVAPYGTHILVEKPFAASLADADAMIAAVAKTRKQLFINWPLRWYPSHITAQRLVSEGVIGQPLQVHYYDGNKGPLLHGADKVDKKGGRKSLSWWYRKSAGGGSLLDYLGYGTTLGTWFLNGKKPLEVTATVDEPKGLEVDTHSVTVCRYATGLSKFETRWGTLTNPWQLQPQPKCGFVVVGTKGSVASYDFEPTVRVQTEEKPEGVDMPVDKIGAPFHEPIHYVLHLLESGRKADGPLSPRIARIGQQIVDTAYRSAQLKTTLPLID